MPLRRLLIVLLAAAACGGDSVAAPKPGAAVTALPRELTPAERSVGNAANAFTFALWHQVNSGQRDSNVFISPLSASFALGMVLNGAAGQTFDEMRSGLQFGTTPLTSIDSGYRSLIALLTSLDPKVTMQIANSIWYRREFPFNKSFLDAGSAYFDATINPLNFNDAAASLATINGWVSAKTNGRIPSIIDEIHSEDVMFLINAIYFKGSWRNAFDPKLTQSSQFHGVAGDQPVKLMYRDGLVSYAQTAAYQAVDLPYGDSAFTMTVILPASGTSVDAVAASLDAPAWAALTSQFHSRDLPLYLPKITIEWKRNLIPDLQALGIRQAFIDGGADFTGMSPLGRQLVISRVQQKTFVDVNEEGTEAAAVTGVDVVVTSAPLPMRVDRPYIFAIRERLTGTVLFMGKVVRMP